MIYETEAREGVEEEINVDAQEISTEEAPEIKGAENEEEKTEEKDANPTSDATDYAKIIEADIEELRDAFPELKDLNAISELENPMRFAALRDLGLSATEAYLATSAPRPAYDNRAHLRASVPGGAGVATEMSRSEYAMARDIFTDLSDSEIRKLYRKVTK